MGFGLCFASQASQKGVGFAMAEVVWIQFVLDRLAFETNGLVGL